MHGRSVGAFMALVHAKLFVACSDEAMHANAAHPSMGPSAPVARNRAAHSTVESLPVGIAQNAAEGIAQPLVRRLRAFVEVLLARDHGLEGPALTAARNRAIQVLHGLTKAQAKVDKAAAAAAPAPAPGEATASAAAAGALEARFSQAGNRDREVPDVLFHAVDDAANGLCEPVPDLATVDLLGGLRALAAREGWDLKGLPAGAVRPSKAASIVALSPAVRDAVDELGKLLYRLLPYPFTEEAARANPMPYMAVTHELNIIFEARTTKAVRAIEARYLMAMGPPPP